MGIGHIPPSSLQDGFLNLPNEKKKRSVCVCVAGGGGGGGGRLWQDLANNRELVRPSRFDYRI